MRGPLSRKRLPFPQIPIQPDKVPPQTKPLRLLDRRLPAPALHPHAVNADDRTGPVTVDVAMNVERQRRRILQRGQDPLAAAVAQRAKPHRHLYVNDAHALEQPPFASTGPGLVAPNVEHRAHAHLLELSVMPPQPRGMAAPDARGDR